MGALLCKRQICDETDVNTKGPKEEVADKFVNENALKSDTSSVDINAKKSSRENSKTGGNTEIKRTHSKSFSRGKKKGKICVIQDTELDYGAKTSISGNDNEADIDSGVETNVSPRHLNDCDEAIRMERFEDWDMRNHTIQVAEKLSSDNSSGYQSHSELTSSDGVDTNDEKQTYKKTCTRHIVRRHQSLPADKLTSRPRVAMQSRIILPRMISEKRETNLDENHEEKSAYEHFVFRENVYSTSDPRNRPRAARGTRSRPNSFHVGPKRNCLLSSDQSMIDNLFLARRENTEHATSTRAVSRLSTQSNENKNLQRDISDIRIHISRTDPVCLVDSEDQTTPAYKASVVIDGIKYSGEIKSEWREDKHTKRNRAIGCNVRVNFSSSDMCQISLPRDILLSHP